MKHFMVCIGALVLALSVLHADQPSPVPPAAPAPAAAPTDGPRIQFDNDMFDAGKVPPGQAINHTFIFTNVGNQTLEVSKVNPTCGCTIASPWTKTVEPGKTGTIPLTVNVNPTWNGQMTKVVTVESNDKSRPGPSSITIKFVVWKPLEISKPYVFLNVPPESTNVVAEAVRVDNNTEQPVALYDAQSSNPSIGVEIKTNELGKHYELVVSAKPPFKNGNNVSGQITAKTSATNMSTISLGATANIQPIMSINPPMISLDPAPLTNVIQKPVTISYLGSTAIHMSNAVFNAKGVDVQLSEATPGRVFTVTLSFPPGFDSNGRKMELTVNSSSPQMPVITVPVLQMPRPGHAIVPGKANVGGAPQASIQVH